MRFVKDYGFGLESVDVVEGVVYCVDEKEGRGDQGKVKGYC
jgi:hypothetical protein